MFVIRSINSSEAKMAKIQVYKHNSDKLIGTGNGTITKTTATATIDSWIDKGGLQAGTVYTLRTEGKTYADARCTQVVLPVKFSNVV